MSHRRAFLAALALALAAGARAQAPEGQDLYYRPDKGYCIACHDVSQSPEVPRRSDAGPLLEGSRMRLLGKGAIRDRIHDPSHANAQSVMPPYGRHRILDSREIDRIVDYLHALP